MGVVKNPVKNPISYDWQGDSTMQIFIRYIS